jgi:hypothetical protein
VSLKRRRKKTKREPKSQDDLGGKNPEILRQEWDILAARADTDQAQCDLYWLKWVQLKSADSLFPLEFRHVPWPIFHVRSSEDITPNRVERFITRASNDFQVPANTTDKKKALQSALRLWHSDKFQVWVLRRVVQYQKEEVECAAKAICRILIEKLDEVRQELRHTS